MKKRIVIIAVTAMVIFAAYPPHTGHSQVNVDSVLSPLNTRLTDSVRVLKDSTNAVSLRVIKRVNFLEHFFKHKHKKR